MKKIALKKNQIAPVSFSGDPILAELRNQSDAIQARITSLEISMHIIKIEESEWNLFRKKAQNQAGNSQDSIRQATFDRLDSVATKSAARYAEQKQKIQSVLEELNEAAGRLAESVAMMNIERNLHSVMKSLPADVAMEPVIEYKENLREIQRVLYTADAVLELTR